MARHSFVKKKTNKLRNFKYLVATSLLLTASYYAVNNYMMFTRDTTIAEHTKAKVVEFFVEAHDNFLSDARASDSLALNELSLFIDKYEKKNKVNNLEGKINKIRDISIVEEYEEELIEEPTEKVRVLKTEKNKSAELKPVSQSQKDFSEKHFLAAKRVEKTDMIPAIFLIGQAGHESGWGRREINYADGTPSYNLFGIKATNWSGKTVDITTTEHVKGRDVKMVQKFRAYDSYEDSFRDYARLINNSPRYERAREAAHQFAREIQNAGYATDPNYAAKLERSIMSVK